MMRPLCIYHHGCADGFAAAWAVRRYFAGEADFHPGIYGEAPPDVCGRPVYLVDFSYPRETILAMAEQAISLTIIDHHKTAAAALQDLPLRAHAIFDMNKSGAMLTWEHFFPGETPPLLFDYIQDRDLWRFRLPMTREVMASVFSYPMTFEDWDALMQVSVRTLEQAGRAILRKHDADVAALVDNATRWIELAGVTVPSANVPWMFASDVAGELAKGNPFAATWYDDEDGRRWSLRSDPDGMDVAAIAEQFGGGGHKHAAGFRMTREEAIEFEIMGAAGAATVKESLTVETSAPAIVFFPCGSLGEAIEEGCAA